MPRSEFAYLRDCFTDYNPEDLTPEAKAYLNRERDNNSSLDNNHAVKKKNVSSQSKTIKEHIANQPKEVFIAPPPQDAEYELYGNFFKVITKGSKKFVMANGYNGWRKSTIDYGELIRNGRRIRNNSF